MKLLQKMTSRRNFVEQILCAGAALPSLAKAQVTSSSSSTLPPAREIVGLGKPQQAVILPLSTGSFAWANQALKAGILAAHQRDGQQKPLLLQEVDDKSADLYATLAEFQSEGIQWVAGPLTRSGVNAYIDAGTALVNTLTLNVPDADRNIPSNLLTFGLATEGEARQIAIRAFDDAALKEPVRRPLRAVALTAANASARRSAAAFVDAWRELGGDTPLPIEIENRPNSEIKNALEPYQADVHFVSLSVEQLRTVRVALDKSVQIYSTSQLSLLGQANAKYANELEGVKLVDMPWLAIPDHPVVLAYPKAPARFNNEMTRLYALGLDAYRLIFDVLPFPQRIGLEGATGRLAINRKQSRIERLATFMQYQNGQLVVLN